MKIETFDDTKCSLGEGPLWHPKRGEFFWFDIIEKQLLRRFETKTVQTQFNRHVSAAGWLDQDNLLIADEFGLFKFDLNNGDQTRIADIEKDNAITRSNDGRADPFGGFWIGTMGKKAEPAAGAIYRYYRGEVRQLFGNIDIPNSICFSPNKQTAYFSDTVTKKIMQVALDQNEGWPMGEPSIFVDLAAEELNPDGSVVDANGNLWNAQWGAGRVAQYSENGSFLSEIKLPASQITCPAFCGENLDKMHITSAKVDLEKEEPQAGETFLVDIGIKGQQEHQVIL
ncbi:SMP-30/gluconolactonase/LRE family protein [Maritalea sp.]|uniref:SMP-30/gluconolactonase/LRE family protein n=1 Tax=Maritalea sp. TaxID=2003361 RepID=UPI003EF67BE1